MRVSLGSLALLLALSWIAPHAHAQSRAQLARSRALFEAGLAHAQAEEWADARASFEAALAITERPSILLNLATAQAETGALVASAASYRRFLEIASAAERRQHGSEVRTALAAVEARFAHLTIDPAQLRPTDEVVLDDTLLARETLGNTMELDPGAHHVVVRREARDALDQRFDLAEGESRSMTLLVPELAPAAVAEAALESSEAPVETASGGDDGLAIGLGIGIGVGVAVIAGVVIGVVLGTSGEPATYQGNVGAGVITF